MDGTLLTPIPSGTTVTIDGVSYLVDRQDRDDVYLIALRGPRGPWVFTRAQADAGTVDVRAGAVRS